MRCGWRPGELGGRPVMEAIHGTGLWAIRFLLISLAITPLARALDWPGLLLVRRNVGRRRRVLRRRASVPLRRRSEFQAADGDDRKSRCGST